MLSIKIKFNRISTKVPLIKKTLNLFKRHTDKNIIPGDFYNYSLNVCLSA